jgi:hypothetical protein
MPFQIPEEDIAPIGILKAMPRASVEAFVKALKTVPPTVDTDEIAQRISSQVPSIPPAELERVLDALYGLYFIRELSGVKRETFLQDFIDGIQNVPVLAVEAKEVDKLREKFAKLLDIGIFNLLSKAKRLQRDGERLYCDAKIISDIRPVFGAKPTDRPTGAVVTHTLKLGYHEGGEHKEFHIILDLVDLDLLTSIVNRALAKDTTLRGLLKEMRCPDLGV